MEQLEEQLQRAGETSDKYYGLWQKADKELETKRNNEMFALKSENGELANQVRNLMEIIRWQIRPNTAESPFMPDKNQRDERKSY